MAQQVKDRHCHHTSLGHCCGMDSIHGLELPHAMGVAKKKKKNCHLNIIGISCFLLI